MHVFMYFLYLVPTFLPMQLHHSEKGFINGYCFAEFTEIGNGNMMNALLTYDIRRDVFLCTYVAQYYSMLTASEGLIPITALAVSFPYLITLISVSFFPRIPG